MYNLSVAREFLKQVYVAERLQPPTNLSTIQNAYSTIWSRASSPSYWKDIFRTGEYAKIGIYAVEAYGIFKVSPMFSLATSDYVPSPHESYGANVLHR